jgi:cyanate permease
VRAVERRAARIARLVAIVTTLPLAAYVAWSLPTERTARLVGAGSVVLWYLLTFLIGKRIALEWLK